MARVLPFLISGVLVLIGLVTTRRLDERLKRYVTGSKDQDVLADGPSHLQPGPLKNVVLYWVDLTQATALLIGPVLGLLTIVNLADPVVAFAYAVAILGGVCMMLWLGLAADESTYSSRFGRLGLTTVTTIALVIDIGAGLVAYFFGGGGARP
jgi:hypothetical protein